MTVALRQIVAVVTPSDGSPPRLKVFANPAEAQAAHTKGAASGRFAEIALCVPFQVWTKPEGEG